MWNITPEDIEAAKLVWQQRRDEMIARHQQEVSTLEADFRLIATVEDSLKTFLDHFKTPVPITKEVERAAGLARRLVGEMIERDGAETETVTPTLS